MALVFLTCIVSALYVALLFYYGSGWKALSQKTSLQKGDVMISVIIPARNESKRIPHLLKALIAQTYPVSKFEVIVIDDHSTDDTVEVIRKSNLSNLFVISLADHVTEPINSYKKKAIEVAIARSAGDLIVTTDADCVMGSRWLETIASSYVDGNPDMLILPVMLHPTRSLLDIFQALDFMTLQGVTGGAVYYNAHAMCNGANLAYTKKIFHEVKGFEGVDGLASGDDCF